MITIKNTIYASKGCFIKSKVDLKIFGPCIVLGIGDSIDNYEEYEYTEEEYRNFYKELLNLEDDFIVSQE